MVNPWILVPLYIYPTSNAWKPLYSAIEANANLNFKVIINPNSGPGVAAGSYPDANYITGISKLNGYKNVDLLGYVDTAYAQRSYAEATADVDAYASWAKYTKSDIHMDGIFFDDNPNNDQQSAVSYLTNIAKYSRAKLGKSAHICLNPGTYVSDKWYNIADSIVAFEDQYSDFSDSSLNTVKSSQRAKSVFIVHSFKGTTAQLQTLVNKIQKTGGMAGSYITSASNYDSFPGYISGYAKYVAAVTSTKTSATSTKKTSKRDDEEDIEVSETALEGTEDNTLEARANKNHTSSPKTSHTSSHTRSHSTKHVSKATKTGSHSHSKTKSATHSTHSASHRVDNKKGGHTVHTTPTAVSRLPKQASASHKGQHTSKHSTHSKHATHSTHHHKSTGVVGKGTPHATRSTVTTTITPSASVHPKRWHARGFVADAQPIAAY